MTVIFLNLKTNKIIKSNIEYSYPGNLELTINPNQRDEFMEWVMKNNFIDDLYGYLHGWMKVHVQNPEHECVFTWF